MQNFLSLMAENTFAIIIAVMGFFGCLAYGIAGKGMSVLYNESLSMTASSHPFIRQLKLRRENGMRINTSIHNTQAFVLKNMERYRYLNLSIDEYVKTAWLIQLICIMLGLMSGIIKQNMWYTAYGCVCAVAVACVGKIEDIEKKESRIVVNIVDYFDNVLSNDRVRAGEIEDEPDMEPVNEKAEAENNGAGYGGSRAMTKRKLLQEDKTAACNTDIKISDEQIKLIEDVLREYLA